MTPPPSVNHRRPSGPRVMYGWEPPFETATSIRAVGGKGNSVTVPVAVMRPSLAAAAPLGRGPPLGTGRAPWAPTPVISVRFAGIGRPLRRRPSAVPRRGPARRVAARRTGAPGPAPGRRRGRGPPGGPDPPPP